MLQKLAVMMSAVPHYLLALALLVSLYGPQVVQLLTGSPYASYVPWVAHAVTFAVGILALAKQFSPGSEAAVKVDAEIKQKPGYVPPGAIGLILFIVGLACTVQACTPAAVQTAETTVPADLNLGLCILNVAEQDAGKPVGQVLLDELAQCSAKIAPIVTVLDGVEVARLAHHTITLDQANASIQAIHAAAKLPAPKLLVLPAVVAK